MKDASIEELAYILKQASDNQRPKPIFFLGAGASKSGEIPLAYEIVKDVLDKYSEAPSIKKLGNEEKTYTNLMEHLRPSERDELLNEYIGKAKINVAHIYLAQLMVHDYVDYVLTVNFDNLMLRALALFNVFPPTYDMAILKDLTTSTFKEKSVVYLHGQHHGLWLLNTREEMKKVKDTVRSIFHSIKNRPWVFLGYSGSDPIFEQIKKLGRFDNGLYWVCYHDNNPSNKVKNFMERPNTNASIIRGYDADSFMLKLNTELGLESPKIIDRPFTSIKEMLNNIVDIQEDKHYEYVKERLEISKRQVNEAIKQYELGKISPVKVKITIKRITKDILKKELINLIIEANFKSDRIKYIEEYAHKLKDEELNNLLAILYSDWGVQIADDAITFKGNRAEELFKLSYSKYEKSISFNPNTSEVYNNKGTLLVDWAKRKRGDESEKLFEESFSNFKIAISINPDMYQVYNNWGTALGEIAELKNAKDAEKIYQDSFLLFEKAMMINDKDADTFFNWGYTLVKYAKTKKENEAKPIIIEAIQKFEKGYVLKPNDYLNLNNWGYCLGILAKISKGPVAKKLYKEAISKFECAIEIKPDFGGAFYKLGELLGNFASVNKGKESEKLYQEAIYKLEKAIELGEKKYNLSYVYALKGDEINALKYLDLSLYNEEIKVSIIREDKLWKPYLQREGFIKLLAKYDNN